MNAAPPHTAAAGARTAPSGVRTFTSPSGRAWTASVVEGGQGVPVLRFRAGDVVLDLSHVPQGWDALPDGALVDLVRRAAPPTFTPPPGTEPPAAPELRAPAPAAPTGRRSAGESFADRMAVAFLGLQVRQRGPGGRLERVSPEALAAIVAERLGAAGVPRAVEPAEAVGWFADSLPDLPTTLAIAEACGVDPGWLAFGASSSARVPVLAPGGGSRTSHRASRA